MNQVPGEEIIGFEDTLTNITERIRENEGRRKRVAEALQGFRCMSIGGIGGIIEQSLVNRVEIDPMADSTVAGVDGGMLEQQLHGLDLVIVRAVAAIFHYRGGGLDWVKYFPGEIPFPKLIDVAEPLDAKEFEFLAGMERQITEIEVAIGAAEENVGMLLLDGSVVPQYVDRFPRNPLLLDRYQKLIGAYSTLYQTCQENGVLLAGAVKDSRGGRFVDVLRKKVLPAFGNLGLDEKDLAILERSRDTVLLDHLLGVGERTPSFTYAEEPAAYVLQDLGIWAAKIHAFYLKTVPFDRPLRVEFVDCSQGVTESADRIASKVYALASNHEAFGLPSVLIEADARARLAEEELCIVRDSISDRLGPSSLLDLRRERRPF